MPRTSTGEVRLRLKLDMSVFSELEGFEEQLPFATSLAINRTGVLAYKALRATLGDYFTLRNKWTTGSVTITKATDKRDPHPRIEIGSVAKYMQAHTIGTRTRGRNEGRRPIGAIPVGAREGDQPLSKKSLWPMALIRRGLAYRPGIDGRRKKGKKRPALAPGQLILASEKYSRLAKGTLLYAVALDSSTKIKPRWPLNKLVRKTFANEWRTEARKAIRFAIKTARRK